MRRGWVRFALSRVFPVALVLGLAGVWAIGTLLTSSTNRSVKAFAPPARAIRIASEPGIRLAASYLPATAPTAPAILLLHGNGGHRGDVESTAQWLAADGYTVLAIDFRGHGESSPAGKSFGWFEARDAHAAFDWLRAHHPHSRIGVIGFSLGGAAAVIGPQGPLQPDALILEAVYPDIRHAIYNRIAAHAGWLPATIVEPLLSYQSWLRFGVLPDAISPARALANVRAPVMIVGGGADCYTPVEETESLYGAVRVDREIWLLDGLSHDQVVAAQSGAFRARLLSFLDRHLKQTS